MKVGRDSQSALIAPTRVAPTRGNDPESSRTTEVGLPPTRGCRGGGACTTVVGIPPTHGGRVEGGGGAGQDVVAKRVDKKACNELYPVVGSGALKGLERGQRVHQKKSDRGLLRDGTHLKPR